MKKQIINNNTQVVVTVGVRGSLSSRADSKHYVTIGDVRAKNLDDDQNGTLVVSVDLTPEEAAKIPNLYNTTVYQFRNKPRNFVCVLDDYEVEYENERQVAYESQQR